MKINYNKAILLGFYILSIGFSQSESLSLIISDDDSIIFTSYPKQLHFYARDLETNNCTFNIIGEKIGSINGILIEIHKNDTLISDYLVSDTSFSLNITIDAGLHLYDVYVYLDNENGEWDELYDAQDIVCGDAYLIQGQSNAVAYGNNLWGSGYGNELTNIFARSYGKRDIDFNFENNSEFGIAVVDSMNTHAYIGVWGLQIANEIIDLHGIPVFILNGADGWTTAEDHLRNNENYLDFGTLYGKLLWRAQSAQLSNKIRAIFWYQGETDGYTPYDEYLNNITEIHDAWVEDYPNIEGIYNYQPRKCCFWPDSLWSPQRSVNRELPNLLPMVKGNMSTTAVDPYYWHFSTYGYITLGENMARLIHRDLYSQVYDYNIEAPNPQKIYWLDNDKIAIDFGETGNGLILQEGAEEYFSISDSSINFTVDINGSKIILTTGCQDSVDWVSFIEGYTRTDIPWTDYPWLINDLNIGSFGFHQIALDPSRPWYVSLNGSDENGCGSTSNPFRTIQKAIEFADNKDTIFVSEGTYNGPINFSGKNIGIIGENKETTIIDGQNESVCVEISMGEDSTIILKGFTITNGFSSTPGGGIYCSGAKASLSDLIIRHNSSNGEGGGILIENTPLAELRNVLIDSNTTGGDGGGITILDNSTVNIIESHVEANTADNNGGGITILDNSTVNIIESHVEANTADNNGGGIYFDNESSPGYLTLENSFIENNATIGWNGFTNNGWSGGGLYLIGTSDENSNVNITNTTIINNTSFNGSAISALSSIVKLNSSLICNNMTTTQNFPSTIELFYNSTLELFNVTATNNIAIDGGLIKSGGSSSSEIGPSIIIKNSIIWDESLYQVYFNGGDADPGYVGIASSNINGGETSVFTNDNALFNWGSGNMNTNPLFVDIVNNNFQLMDNSPCLGVGLDNPLNLDIIGYPRPVPYGSRPDLGCYENIYGLYGDVTMNGVVSSLDASLILQHVVGIDTLDALETFYGDVSQNGQLSALDASFVLQYVVGLIDHLPYITEDNLSMSGDFTMDDIDAIPGRTIEIPIRIINDENIFGFRGTLNYDPSVLSLDSVLTGDYFNNCLLLSNEFKEGQVYIGGSGYQPEENSDQIAIVVFSILDNFNNYTRISITDLRINDNEPIAMATQMTVSHTLGLDGHIPQTFTLYQNYPNPFNPMTKIRYDLPKEAFVTVNIYNMLGNAVKKLVNKKEIAGYKSVQWNATNNEGQPVSAGIYLYRIETKEFSKTKKMILLK